VQRVQLPDVDFNLPSSFVIEFQNTGLGEGGAEIIVDLGAAVLQEYELRPSELAKPIYGGPQSSVLKIRVERLVPGERLYVYSLISAPTFRTITVTPVGNGYRNTYDFDMYKQSTQSTATDTSMMSYTEDSFTILHFLALIGLMMLVFFAYLLIVLAQLINRWLRL
jgi:hypothetical protein